MPPVKVSLRAVGRGVLNGRSGGGPRCFLHVPKSGGVSVYSALIHAFPPADISRKRYDTSMFCCGFTDFDALSKELREAFVIDEDEFAELAASKLASGHFSLSTLLRVTSPGMIATVVREPRARLLSLYAFWRLTPGLLEQWRPYDAAAHALRPLDEFLSEPGLAPSVDNAVCRAILHGHAAIPPLDFIAPDDVEALALEAIERLDELGFVGVLEHGRSTWLGLSKLFGVELSPFNENATGSSGIAGGLLPFREPISELTFDLLDARAAVDALIYRHALAAAGCDERRAERIRDTAFAAQLVRLGDIAGVSAARAAEHAGRLAELEAEITALQANLDAVTRERERYLAQVQAIVRSRSWRMTAPLRDLRHRISGIR
jgi:hypothetical protein